jgi:lysophospholipase L1-like esterase
MSDQPMTWVFAGDSITQGVFHTHGARSWVEHVHERLRWQLGRLHDVVINTGMSGWTAPEVSDAFDHLVGRFSPDVVSVSLGMNDALEGPRGRPAFRHSLRQLVSRSADLGAQVVLQTPTPAGREALPGRTDLPAYADIVRELAADLDVILVDHAADWAANVGPAGPAEWLDDPVHPNAVGHRRMADVALSSLGLGPLEDRA